MQRESHFGNRSARWNTINRELWNRVGLRVPFEALVKIREIRRSRHGRQGNTEGKRECKILLAVRDNLDWRRFDSMVIEHVVGEADGGRDEASNLKVRDPYGAPS